MIYRSEASLASLEFRGGGAGGEVFLGILCGGVMPGSPNPDPISDTKWSFSSPVFRPGVGRNYVIIT